MGSRKRALVSESRCHSGIHGRELKAAYAVLHHWRTIPWIVINYNPPFIRCAGPCICRIRYEKYHGSPWDGIIANLVRDHNESSWVFSWLVWIRRRRALDRDHDGNRTFHGSRAISVRARRISSARRKLPGTPKAHRQSFINSQTTIDKYDSFLPL